ncbi:isochorismatase family protein [Vibrio orientalis]|uniref:Isochorismatase n=2 Tax=Vibrio orientalis CIP 102891 = ATCC 33934 TaxID=675816 RepID=A0ABP2GYV9_VIBOR|nr:isochorismatase family protein [Vibrio orientalis]EEX92115.1 isochorismatase [Vibrio orientalis CIP 102891 = ATCC 33934]
MLSRDKTGLIVVDVQGKLARLVYDSETLVSNCSKLIVGARALGLPIVLLEQNPEKLGETVEELRVPLGEVNPITKFTFNACESPDFLATIKDMDVDTWLVCGIEAHICVYQTAKGLVELGFNVELVNDCVSSRTLSNVQLGINRLKESGVGISGLEMCLYELVKDCRAAEFKQVLSLIR